MKSSTILSLLAVTCTFCSCSDIMEEPVVSSVEMKISQELDYKVTPDEAMEIANGFFKQKLSRSAVLNTDYATITPKSRAESADTLAYIVTPSDGEGFVLVSTDKRMPPVLAFSETGTFSYTESPDDPVYANFVSNLDKYRDYLIYSTSGYDFKKSDGLFDEMIELCPGEHWQWDQFSPIYTKYIHEEHPVSPVGCVALSTGMVMLYCKDGITIHNEKFDFENIRKTYYVHTTYQAELDTTPKGPIIEPIYNSTNSSNLGDRFPNDKFIYSLENANDRIAKLLYYIGKDLNLKYDELTYGYASDVIPYLKSLDYNVTTTFLKYDIVDIARHIRQKNIVYIYGSGHAWIIDGCCFNYISENKDDIEDIFIRCNWGSDPKYNGYYCGDVFMMYWCDFNPYEYFVIGKSRTSNI